VILFVFGVGFENISEAVADFYKFDKITNIERVYPENVTFPAITICTRGEYWREHYRNGSLIRRDEVSSSLLEHFLDHPVNEVIFDCFRFNAVTNRSVELFKASSILDQFLIYLNKFYIEDISNIEYYNYTILSGNFIIYVGDNSLNSFENLQYLVLDPSSFYNIEIEKVSIETKLPEPYNPCKKSSVDEPFHQTNCIEACTYKEIKNKYNCTFQSTLFSIEGFRQCSLNYRILKTEFSANCPKECPLESCFSEKFNFYSTKKTRPTFYSKDSSIFTLFFRDLGTLNITQIPKTDPFTFLNNIGGGLGLFMGIAFPNLIEFLQFILEIVLIIFIRKIN